MFEKAEVVTRMGKIALEKRKGSGADTLIFIHGLYFDRHMWDAYTQALPQVPAVLLDMPHHGASQSPAKAWNMRDCAEMLLEVLDALKITQVIGIGHSWGSMTLMRAAVLKPERFAALGLANMPLAPGNGFKQIGYALLSTTMLWRDFYTTQAAHALFAKASLRAHPELLPSFRQTMGCLSNRSLRRVDTAVRMAVDSGYVWLNQLKVPALALRGEQDYVPDPSPIPLRVVPGGHISPLEAREEMLDFIQRVMDLAKRNS
jgi:pimeloyl-ACP methyl ester carboxylesterase